jgi:hypothetical protein
MRKPLIVIVAAFVIALGSWSCRRTAQVAATQVNFNSAVGVGKVKLPEPLVDRSDTLEQIEIRKAPNGPVHEYLLRALPNGDNDYVYEVDKRIPAPQYGPIAFAVNFSPEAKARAATQEEWDNASRLQTKPRLAFSNGKNDETGEIEYRLRRYRKTGKYWGHGLLSPSGRWLAVFSYTGVKPPPSFFHFLGGGSPPDGDVFWQVYDTVTGNKVFEWEAKNVKSPASRNTPAAWIEDRYFLFPDEGESQDFMVVTLPPVTPEVNPVTVEFPSRKDASGQPLPPGASDEVWIPLAPLTKEQAAKLTARQDTEITEVRFSSLSLPKELLFAINEETENHPADLRQGDGGGGYHFRLISTYYYAVSLEDPTKTRFATKEEWDHAQRARASIDRPEAAEGPLKATITGKIPPNRAFPKTGAEWPSVPTLSAREWLAVFSYTPDAPNDRSDGKLFVDVYQQRSGEKLLSTTLPFTTAPDKLFKAALSIENKYILLPLNDSLTSFALWRLP